MQDLSVIFQWWFTIFIIGVIFLPFTTRFFSNFFDKGYIFSKILGIAVISYVVFILGLSHIAPFNIITIISATVIFLTLNFVFLRKSLIKIFKKNWYFFLLEEIIFFFTLLFWSFVRSHQPEIHGLEKYMDFGFINSILRSEYFPPKDMWFTPLSINYYYFGHLVTAVLTKLSNIPSNITYNLMLSSIFAFTFTASFSIGANLIYVLFTKRGMVRQEGIPTARSEKFERALAGGKVGTGPRAKIMILVSGFLTAILVSFAGNLQMFYAFFKPYQNENPVPFWNLAFSPNTFPNSYWYPNATRFIANTIHEFPIYSFVVSDLHGHVLDIPFVLLTIAILLSLFIKSQITKHPLRSEAGKSEINSNTQNSKRSGFFNLGNWNLFGAWNLRFGILLLGFILTIMYMTNVWDGIIYLLLTVLVLFYPVLSSFKDSSKKKSLSKWFFSVIAIGILFLIFSLPFNLNFKPFTSGVGILCSPQFLIDKGKIGPFLFESDHCQRSPLWQLAMLYGFFYFWVITFFLFIFKKKNPESETLNSKQTQNHKYQKAKQFDLLNLRTWNLFRNWPSTIKNFINGVNYDFGILSPSDIFVLILIFLSTVLIIIPEFIYIKDIYPAHYRANTMFKLVYQSFILLSISSSYIIVRLISNSNFQIQIFKNYWKLIVFAAGGILIVLVLLYPQFAVGSYYGDLKTNFGIDGTKYLKKLYPTDYDAIAWINKNIKDQPVILEAQGDSYTDFARISSNTGLPTVLGWTVHEWLWRGTYDIPAPRIAEVKTLYETQDANIARQLIKKYKISYVFLGDLEYQQYSNLDEQKFQKIGKTVYQNGRTKIYKIN